MIKQINDMMSIIIRYEISKKMMKTLIKTGNWNTVIQSVRELWHRTKKIKSARLFQLLAKIWSQNIGRSSIVRLADDSK